MNDLRWFLLLLLISSSALVASGDADKVSFEIYYETLCPYCANLIANYVYKIFDSDLITITDLKLFPSGNIFSYNGTDYCQHGPKECLLNTVEACAIHTWPDVKDHFPFIHCVENLAYNHDYNSWNTCFKKVGLDDTPVINCLNGELGEKLNFVYKKITDSLEPPHTYVPWVVVDGQPLYEDYLTFVSAICKAYKGSKKPHACAKAESSAESQSSIRKMKTKLYCPYTEGVSQSKLFQVGQKLISWARSVGVIA